MLAWDRGNLWVVGAWVVEVFCIRFLRGIGRGDMDHVTNGWGTGFRGPKSLRLTGFCSIDTAWKSFYSTCRGGSQHYEAGIWWPKGAWFLSTNGYRTLGGENIHVRLQIFQRVPPEGRGGGGRGGGKVLALLVQSLSVYIVVICGLWWHECICHSHPPTLLHGSSTWQAN